MVPSGVYVILEDALRFLPVRPTTTPEPGRLGRDLERQGLLVWDVENSSYVESGSLSVELCAQRRAGASTASNGS